MQQAQPGQRVPVSAKADCRISMRGGEAARIAIAAIAVGGGQGGGQGGRVLAFERTDPQHWWMQGMAELEGDFEIVAYVMDDRHGGFANAAYPIEFEVDGTAHQMPPPTEQLAAVILAEVYTRNGERRMKLSNEGFTFGIDAYVRARNLGAVLVPYRNAPAVPPPGGPYPDGPYPVGQGRPVPVPGQMLGTGSGVLIGADLIVTNAHVVEDGKTFEVGRARDAATVLAVDVHHDLALLRCQTAGTPLPLRIGSPLWLGEDIMAAGFPLIDVLGADLKVTTGNVSGLTGSGGDVARFQFSAPIGSGSSGGAIIDEFGNLVGITSSSLAHDNMRSRGSISENVNFGIRAALVFELAAAAGAELPPPGLSTDNLRRNVVGRARGAVVSLIIHA